MKSRRARRPRRQAGEGRREFTTGTRVAQAANDAVHQWREEWRVPALRQFARRTARLKWTRALLLVLLDELYVDDLFDDLVGDPLKVAPSQYPQAVALAIALRHSWRPDDLAEVEARLGVRAGRRSGHGT